MDAPHTVTALAELAQVSPDRVRALERLGLIGTGHGSFSSGDVHRIRLMDAFEAAGVPAAALARANEQGTGDGVLVRFPGAGAAVEGTLDILDALADHGLPGGHAGVESGPLIVRDGDVFGRTVNRAARLSDRARDGELLATAELAASLPPGLVRAEPAETVPLQGIAEPARLVRLSREGTRS